MKPSNPVFLFIFTLILSFAASFIVLTVKDGKELDAETKDIDHFFLYQNYRTLTHFLNLSIPEEPPADEEIANSVSHPLALDLLALRKTKELLKEKKYAQVGKILEQLVSKHPFVDYQRQDIYLRYLYLTQNYARFVIHFQELPLSQRTLELELLYLNSQIKTNQKDKAFVLFKRLFSHHKLGPFKSHISQGTLNEFLKKLDYDYWFKKFKFLASGGQYTEFMRQKRYIHSPQLIDLFQAEFYYRKKQYSRCKYYLSKVKSPLLLTYKLRMELKMQLRNKDYGHLNSILADVKPDTESYIELLLDSASLMLINGEPDTALVLFTRYIHAVQWQHLCQSLQWWAPKPKSNSDYWKALWRCAWLNYNKGNKKEAIRFFKQGIHANMDSFKIANRYWLNKIAPQEAEQLGINIDQFPFSYYYTLVNDDYPVALESMASFIQLLNQPRDSKMDETLSQLEMLLTSGLIEESVNFIRWNLTASAFSTADRHTLIFLESIIHLNRGNPALAFIRLRDNIDCYRCLRVPKFLQALVLPVKYADIIEENCEINNLDPTLIFSLIREESYFRTNAASYANAYGLMQLLPKTARQMSDNPGRKIRSRDLFNPELNIRYGTRYLRFLLDKYNNKIYLALAAYNAGDHRVDLWLSRFGELPEEQFIEMIPFSATRSYVKNILRNYYYYKYYYGVNEKNG